MTTRRHKPDASWRKDFKDPYDSSSADQSSPNLSNGVAAENVATSHAAITPMESTSTVATYGSESARNHEIFEVDTIKSVTAQNMRLRDEIEMGKKNFLFIQKKLNEIDSQMADQKSHFNGQFQELDKDLNDQYKRDQDTKARIMQDHNNLVQSVANLRIEFERTTASLEKKIGDIMKILREKSQDIFSPGERSIPNIGGT